MNSRAAGLSSSGHSTSCRPAITVAAPSRITVGTKSIPTLNPEMTANAASSTTAVRASARAERLDLAHQR